MSAAWTQLFPAKPRFTETSITSLSGKVFIVTGGNAGVGFELVKILWCKGGKIYIASRSQTKTNEAITKLKSIPTSTPGQVKHLFLDLSDLTTIKLSVEAFASQETRLDVLWNNAGVAMPPSGSKTPQGHELQMGTNCLGPYLFTRLLLPILRDTAKSAAPAGVRVIFTSSISTESAPEGGICLAELDPSAHSNDQRRNYSMSKAGNWILASEFHRRTQQDGIVCLTQNPGNLRTKIWDTAPLPARIGMKMLLHDPKLGAYTELWAGFSEDVKSEDGGRYVIPWGRWHPNPRLDIMAGLQGREEGGTGIAQEFWEWCEKQTVGFF